MTEKTAAEPVVRVGILKADTINFVLFGEYTVDGAPVTGSQDRKSVV